MRGNWKCSIRGDAADALGIRQRIPNEYFERVIHSKNTSRDAAISAAIYELIPGGLPVPRRDRTVFESLIACEQDDSDWSRTH